MQIPFYHDELKSNAEGIPLANNADFILFGYRETLGSGKRISSTGSLKAKAEKFNLPVKDYSPYLKTRDLPSYKPTCGFGLGWERYTHWLLKLPFIWDACHIPRGELLPTP
jgi:asparaginyl-tRNA synthetase